MRRDHQDREALLYETSVDGEVICHLCRHACRIDRGKRGVCKVRENRDGKLHSLVYGRAVSQHVDPIEKKPLYHFYPGSSAYSIATAGCNFRCRWCQNWQISQLVQMGGDIPGRHVPPRQIVRAALASGSRAIAYTYTEPTIFFEYAYETARMAKAEGIANVFVTNGYMSREMLKMMGPYLDAVNVDLKAFRERTYQKFVGGRLERVLGNLKIMKTMGIWVEVTTLVIPELNDGLEELSGAAAFLAEELGPETPWHVSRFYPTYRWRGQSPTSTATLEAAREIGYERGLRYVYIGNAGALEAADTACPGCGALLIRRSGFNVMLNRIRGDRCPDCGRHIEGVGMGGKELARGS